MSSKNFEPSFVNHVPGVSVHSGFPNPAAESVLENPDFNRLLVTHPVATFCMRVTGHDSEQYGVFDQDIIVIDRALNPQATDLVVWWQNDSFIITKYARLPEREQAWGVISTVIRQYRTKESLK